VTRPLALAIAAATALAACGGGTTPPPDAPPPAWSQGPALPGPRLEPGVTAVGDQLVVLGGFYQSVEQGLGITTEVDVLDTSTVPAAGSGSAMWMQLSAAPVAWTHIQLAASGQILYLLGGLEGANYVAQGSAFALDTSTAGAKWKPLASLPAGFERGSAAVIVAPPRIYLLGGAGTTSALTSNLYYDIVMDAWCPGAACAGSAADQQLPDLPAPRSHPAGMRLADGTLVVVGGLATLDSTQPQSDVWWLPIDQQNTTGQWIAKTPMPVARGGCAYGTIGARLVCAGGEAGVSALHVAEIYEPALDPDPPPQGSAWAALPDMPSERAGAQGAAIGQRFFIPGGAQLLQYEPLATLLELDLDYVPPPVGP
jgi:hypothetical protein